MRICQVVVTAVRVSEIVSRVFLLFLKYLCQDKNSLGVRKRKGHTMGLALQLENCVQYVTMATDVYSWNFRMVNCRSPEGEVFELHRP